MGKILRGLCFVLYKIFPIDEVFHDTFFTGFPHDTNTMLVSTWRRGFVYFSRSYTGYNQVHKHQGARDVAALHVFTIKG